MDNTSRYEIIEAIGHGGMADVYLAHDKILNRQVALKKLNYRAIENDSSALARFNLEAHAITSLIHPNIVEVYDIRDVGDVHYMVMEYVEGHSLKQTIQLRGHLPYKEAVWIMKQLCSGIMEAHKNNIIHRDIKPQNVLLKNDGTAKIADFGIAVLNNSTELTSQNTVLGSVHYLAPELSKGEAPTMQSDIYSLGIVFFEMITGNVPYSGDSAVSIALKHFKEPLPDIKKIDPTIPQSIINIIVKATAKDINERYENVALMLKDLNECLTQNHFNDKPISLNKQKLDKHNEMFSKSTKSNKYKSKKKLDISVISVIILSIISVICIVFMLVLTGVIKFGFNKDVKVPDIINKKLNDANDYLLDYGISIDMTNIQRELTDGIEENTIIRTIPEVGSVVDEGSKIVVVVSGGQYSKLEDFRSKNINDVEKECLSTNIHITKKAVESNEKPGTIINQNPKPNHKYVSGEYLDVELEYSAFKDISLEISYKGRNVNDVANELKEKGANVEIVTKSKEEFTSSDLSTYSPNTVIYSEPSLGTIYSQVDDSVIKLYCYGE